MGFRQRFPKNPEQGEKRGFARFRGPSRPKSPEMQDAHIQARYKEMARREDYNPAPQVPVKGKEDYSRSPLNRTYESESIPLQSHRSEYKPRYKKAPEIEVYNPYAPKEHKAQNYSPYSRHEAVPQSVLSGEKDRSSNAAISGSGFKKIEQNNFGRTAYKDQEYQELQYGRNDLPNPKNQRLRRFEGRVENIKNKVRNQGLISRISEYNQKRKAPPTQQEIDILKMRAEKEKYKYQHGYYRNAQSDLMRMRLGNSFGGNNRRSAYGGRYGSGFGGGLGMGGFGGGSILNSRGGMGMGMGGFGSGLDSLLSSRSAPVKRPVGRPPKQQQRRLGDNLGSLFGTY